MARSSSRGDAEENQDERTPLLANTSGGSGSGHEGDDDLDFDARFRKWKAAVAHKFKRLDRSKKDYPRVLVSVFDGVNGSRAPMAALGEARRRDRVRSAGKPDATLMTGKEFDEQVDHVRRAIVRGILPKMIVTGSSGSYFVRVPVDKGLLYEDESAVHAGSIETTTVAVFKPKDEEPYGNLNPKRQFVRKYLWWAMGRPCLIPNFSYLSEVGASYLDSRLMLQMVPRTELVELSSPSFHYAYSDRNAFEVHGKRLPEKVGSYQTFLDGYAMASDFLRRHPWPSRSRSLALMMRDFEDERQAHKVSRKKEKARLRKCGIALKRLLLCRTAYDDASLKNAQTDDETSPDGGRNGATHSSAVNQPGRTAEMSISAGEDSRDTFVWTPRRMQRFRLELEKLVVLDFLMRNTDRGLDNFMIHHDPVSDEIKIGAIDNSLSFPIKHPNEIRQYPFGWLWLPSDLIGLPFSESTRRHFLPILNDPLWWQDTVQGLRGIFARDPHFDEAKFEKQISVMKGQAWNLIRSLDNPDEGPLDLCAREKRLVMRETMDATEEKLNELEGVKLPLNPAGQIRLDTVGSIETGYNGPVGLSMFDTPIKPQLQRSGSSSNARLGAKGGPLGSRPIGVRASMSYRQALIHAASGPDKLPEGAHPRSLPENDATDPFEDRGVDDSIVDLDQLDDQHRPSQHSRMLSLQEPVTTSKLLLSEREGPHVALDAPRLGFDTVVGRSGIEILDSIDKQRKKEGKIRILVPGRKRSSTQSTVDSADVARSTPVRPSHSRSLSRPTEERVEDGSAVQESSDVQDMISSIVSDPGTHRRGLHQRSSSDTSYRRMASSGYIRRDASSQWDDGVLSEEDEEDEQEGGEGKQGATASNTPAEATSGGAQQRRKQLGRATSGESQTSVGTGNRVSSRAPGPSIEHVLAQAEDYRDLEPSLSTPQKQYVPHLPHARAIAMAGRADDSEAGEQAGGDDCGVAGVIVRAGDIAATASGIGRPATAAEGGESERAGAIDDGSRQGRRSSEAEGRLAAAAEQSPAQPTAKKRQKQRKVKVLVEKLVSDTRQAWLSFI